MNVREGKYFDIEAFKNSFKDESRVVDGYEITKKFTSSKQAEECMYNLNVSGIYHYYFMSWSFHPKRPSDHCVEDPLGREICHICEKHHERKLNFLFY